MKKYNFKDIVNKLTATIYVVSSGNAILNVWTGRGDLIENSCHESYDNAMNLLAGKFPYMIRSFV
jgi:hypothetical protein